MINPTQAEQRIYETLFNESFTLTKNIIKREEAPEQLPDAYNHISRGDLDFIAGRFKALEALSPDFIKLHKKEIVAQILRGMLQAAVCVEEGNEQASTIRKADHLFTSAQSSGQLDVIFSHHFQAAIDKGGFVHRNPQPLLETLLKDSFRRYKLIIQGKDAPEQLHADYTSLVNKDFSFIVKNFAAAVQSYSYPYLEKHQDEVILSIAKGMLRAAVCLEEGNEFAETIKKADDIFEEAINSEDCSAIFIRHFQAAIEKSGYMPEPEEFDPNAAFAKEHSAPLAAHIQQFVADKLTDLGIDDEVKAGLVEQITLAVPEVAANRIAEGFFRAGDGIFILNAKTCENTAEGLIKSLMDFAPNPDDLKYILELLRNVNQTIDQLSFTQYGAMPPKNEIRGALLAEIFWMPLTLNSLERAGENVQLFQHQSEELRARQRALIEDALGEYTLKYIALSLIHDEEVLNLDLNADLASCLRHLIGEQSSHGYNKTLRELIAQQHMLHENRALFHEEIENFCQQFSAKFKQDLLAVQYENRVVPCRIKATPHGKDAMDVLLSISDRTTPEELEFILDKRPEFKWNSGAKAEGKHVLLAAVERDNKLLVNYILAQHPTLASLGDQRGYTALHAACQAGNSEMVLLLLANEANPNIMTTEAFNAETGACPKGATPLWLAAENGDIQLVQMLLLYGGEVKPELSINGKETVEEAKKKLCHKLVEQLVEGQKTLSLKPHLVYEAAASVLKEAISAKAIADQLNFELGIALPPLEIPPANPVTIGGVINLLSENLYAYQESLGKLLQTTLYPHIFQTQGLDQRLFIKALGLIKPAELKKQIAQEIAQQQQAQEIPLREDPQIQEILQVNLEPALLKQAADIDFTLGVEVKEEEDKPLAAQVPLITPRTIEKVEEVVDNIVEQTNIAMLENLFKQMKQDKNIKLKVVEAYEKNWNEGDGALIGEDIKKHEKVLTAERCKLILDQARTLSKVKDLDIGVKNTVERMKKEVSQGKKTKTMIQRVFSDFIGRAKQKLNSLIDEKAKKEKIDGYTRLACHTILQMELEDLMKGPQTTLGSQVENTLLEKLGKGKPDDLALRSKKHEQSQKVLKNMLDAKGMDGFTLENVADKIADAKLQARLEASGLTSQEIPGAMALIKAVENSIERYRAELNKHKNDFSGLDPSYPEKHKLQLMMQKGAMLDRQAENMIGLFFNFALGPLNEGKRSSVFLLKPENEITEFVKVEFDKKIAGIPKMVMEKENQIRPSDTEFARKWKSYLKAEIIQGLEDQQECLIDGVCAGATTRTAVKEQRNPDMSCEDIAKQDVIKIGAIDRYTQAAHLMAVKVKGWVVGQPTGIKAYLQKSYPKAMCMANGIKEARYIDQVIGPTVAGKIGALTEAQITALVDALSRKDNVLKQSNGVLVLSLAMDEGGHRMYLRYDKERNTYHVFDINHGLFELPTKERFTECFVDLLNDYKDSRMPVLMVRAVQLILKTKK